MSKTAIELYINDKLVEFEEPPVILMTYAHTDLHNPTIVKNSYSKTLTVKGTPNNNKVFNCFYDNKWVVGAGYNPSLRMPFELYVNGDVVETGYVKLDSVKKNGEQIEYSITLYGGLGQFLYNLSYKETGDPMKLSDLDYGYDLDMKVNKDTIRDAWLHINDISKTNNVYDFINFAPCYNGIPKDFTANKVAINAANLPEDFKETLTLSDGDFGTVNGWIMGELKDNLDEWKTKDLRSYLQRPVVRMKSIIEACCNPENNGGFTVELDESFFNESNEYWDKAWLTLPLLTEIEGEEGGKDSYLQMDDDKITIANIQDGTILKSLTIPMKMCATANADGASQLYTGVQITLNPSKNTWVESYNACKYVQLVVFDGNDNVVGGSNVNSFYTNIKNAVDFAYEPEFTTTINNIIGNYIKDPNSNLYVFNAAFYDLTIRNIEWQSDYYMKVVMKSSEIKNYEDLGENVGINYLYKRNEYHRPSETVTTVIFNPEVNLQKVEDDKMITKNKILNSEHTPCDYFLSYIKMFNLHIWKDMYENKIYITTRGNYFTNQYYDLEDKIDRGSDMEITPLTFDAKWYNFQTEYNQNGAMYKSYKNEFGIEYGIQKINTNYNFDNSAKDLLENNVFQGCITSVAKSRYFVDIYQDDYSDTLPMPAYVQDGIQTFLYNGFGDTVEGTYITPKVSVAAVQINKGYDLTPKPSFVDIKNEPIEGANCLLFYAGKTEVKDSTDNYIRYQITDDILEFAELNEGEPCWIWTSSPYDSSGNKIANNVSYLPNFSRYIVNENNWITKSWDFGTPKTLYIQDYNIDESSSIYYKFWKPYIADLYSVNTRTLTANVLLQERVIGDWLRRFYYFDNTFWLLNEITDYNPNSNDTTKCTFTRINDTNNYL